MHVLSLNVLNKLLRFTKIIDKPFTLHAMMVVAISEKKLKNLSSLSVKLTYSLGVSTIYFALIKKKVVLWNQKLNNKCDLLRLSITKSKFDTVMEI